MSLYPGQHQNPQNRNSQHRNPAGWTSPLKLGAQLGAQVGALLFFVWIAVPHATAQARSTVAAPPAGSWQTYPYPADGFKAAFPSEPKVDSQNVKTDAGSFELRDYVVDLGSTALYVGVCDYGSSMSGRDPQTVLDGAQNGAINNVKAHVLSSGKITLGSYPGRSFEAENGTLHFSVRIYLVDTILYQSLAAYPVNTQYPNAMRFLDSFQLITRVTK
jgi:hypothetical protein